MNLEELAAVKALRDDEIKGVIDKLTVLVMTGSGFAEPMAKALKRIQEDRDYINELRQLLTDCLGPVASAMLSDPEGMALFARVQKTISTAPDRFAVAEEPPK